MTTPSPRQIGLGALLLGFLVAGFFAVTARGCGGARGLVVERDTELPLIIDGGALAIFAPSPDALLQARIDDGAPVSFTDHRATIAVPAAPGLHVLEVLTGGAAPQRVRAGFVSGPFWRPGTWFSRAARIEVAQQLLDQTVVPWLERALPRKLNAVRGFPGVQSARASLEITGDGIAGWVRFVFENESWIEVAARVRIYVDDTNHLRLVRVGAPELKGTALTTIREGGRMVGMIGAAMIHALGGAKSLSILSALSGSDIAEQMFRNGITLAIDEGLHLVERIVHVPTVIAVAGSDVELRHSRGITFVARNRVSLAFDVRTDSNARSIGFAAPLRAIPPPPPASATVALFISEPLVAALLDGAWRSGSMTRFLSDPRFRNQIASNEAVDFDLRAVSPRLPPSIMLHDRYASLRVAELALLLETRRDHKPRDVRAFADVELRPRWDAEHHGFIIDGAVRDASATCHVREPGAPLRLVPCYRTLLQTIGEQAIAAPGLDDQGALALPLGQLLPTGVDLPFDLDDLRIAVIPGWITISTDAKLR